MSERKTLSVYYGFEDELMRKEQFTVSSNLTMENIEPSIIGNLKEFDEDIHTIFFYVLE